MGKPIYEIFKDFDHVPIGAASIGQVRSTLWPTHGSQLFSDLVYLRATRHSLLRT